MAEFSLAHNRTLRFEDSTLSGKITCDTDGRTRFGISENAHPDCFPEMVECECERAMEIAGEVMREHYWRFDDVNDQDVANKLYDMAVNMGLTRSVRFAQRCVSVVPDGVWGPSTEAAVNRFGTRLLDCLRKESLKHYEHLASADPAKYGPYLNGWRTRALS